MLYEMLTGRVAFPAPTEYARLAAVLNTSPPPLEAVDPTLARLSSFVQLAMQKDRVQRFQTALEMARALSAALGAEAASPANALPLSRLPDVPSMYLPVRSSPTASSGPVPTQQGVGPQGPPLPQPVVDVNVGPGGTLASPHGRSVTEPPPHVVMVTASHGTLPSENLPMFSAHGASGRRGVAPWLVIVLVLGALLAGFLLGFAAARAH
jgi:serine/threonine protein kinase